MQLSERLVAFVDDKPCDVGLGRAVGIACEFDCVALIVLAVWVNEIVANAGWHFEWQIEILLIFFNVAFFTRPIFTSHYDFVLFDDEATDFAVVSARIVFVYRADFQWPFPCVLLVDLETLFVVIFEYVGADTQYLIVRFYE